MAAAKSLQLAQNLNSLGKDTEFSEIKKSSSFIMSTMGNVLVVSYKSRWFDKSNNYYEYLFVSRIKGLNTVKRRQNSTEMTGSDSLSESVSFFNSVLDTVTTMTSNRMTDGETFTIDSKTIKLQFAKHNISSFPEDLNIGGAKMKLPKPCDGNLTQSCDNQTLLQQVLE